MDKLQCVTEHANSLLHEYIASSKGIASCGGAQITFAPNIRSDPTMPHLLNILATLQGQVVAVPTSCLSKG